MSEKVIKYIKSGNRVVATIRKNDLYRNGRVRRVRMVLADGEVLYGTIKEVLPLTEAGKVLKYSGFDSVEEWFEEAKRLHKVKNLGDSFVILLIEIDDPSDNSLTTVSFNVDNDTLKSTDLYAYNTNSNRSAVVRKAVELMLKTDINEVMEVYRRLPSERPAKVVAKIPNSMKKAVDEFALRNKMNRSSALHTAVVLFMNKVVGVAHTNQAYG